MNRRLFRFGRVTSDDARERASAAAAEAFIRFVDRTAFGAIRGQSSPTPGTEKPSFAIFPTALCATHKTPFIARSAELVEQGLGVLEVGGVEAFGKPVVDFGEHRAGFIATSGIAQQPGKTRGRAQFPPSR